MELVTTAIEADTAGRVPEAIGLYMRSLDHFMGALHCMFTSHHIKLRTIIGVIISYIKYLDETDDTKKEGMRKKISEYLERTELLKDVLRNSLQTKYDSKDYKELSAWIVRLHNSLPAPP